MDSTGNATSVGFAISGSTSAYGFNGPDALRTDFFLWNGRGNPSSIAWAISGLSPNTEYVFYAYGAKANAVRYFGLLVDTDGDGSLLDETAQNVGSAASNQSASTDAFFASVFSNAAGQITGTGSAIVGEANWSGFQLATAPTAVPEPATVAFFGIAATGLAARRWRRRTERAPRR